MSIDYRYECLRLSGNLPEARNVRRLGDYERSSDGPMVVHWARPQGSHVPHSLPGILVFQEAFGVNGHILKICRHLADAGYVAAAPELFHRAEKGAVFGYDDFDKVKPVMSGLTNAGLLADARAAHEALVKDPSVDPTRTFAIGFCLGGFVTVLAALNLQLKAAASFYGGGLVKGRPGMGMSPLIGELERLGCPTLFIFGEKDAHIPQEEIQAIRTRLTALHKTFHITVYPDAGHGFVCDERPSYNADAAAEAMGQAILWLK